MSLHAKIMNLPYAAGCEDMEAQRKLDYKAGHRDARHAAAELASAEATHVDELVAALEACLQCFAEMTGLKPGFVEDSIAMSKEVLAKVRGESGK